MNWNWFRFHFRFWQLEQRGSGSGLLSCCWVLPFWENLRSGSDIWKFMWWFSRYGYLSENLGSVTFWRFFTPQKKGLVPTSWCQLGSRLQEPDPEPPISSTLQIRYPYNTSLLSFFARWYWFQFLWMIFFLLVSDLRYSINEFGVNCTLVWLRLWSHNYHYIKD
jgi:hypothetical protein